MLVKNDESTKYIMKELFSDAVSLDFMERQKEIYNRYRFISENEPLPVEKFEEKIVQNRFSKTICENKDILLQFISEVEENNPECKIIFTLIPRYKTMEKYLSFYLTEWKKEFDDFIQDLTQRKNVFFINFKECKEISENNRFFYDICHLNTLGGKCLTSILNEKLDELE